MTNSKQAFGPELYMLFKKTLMVITTLKTDPNICLTLSIIMAMTAHQILDNLEQPCLTLVSVILHRFLKSAFQ